MAADIGARIKLDGEKEFRQALKDSKQELSLLGSQLKLLDAEYAGNEDSSKKLRKEKKLLKEEAKEEKEQIKLLEDRLKAAAAAYGETDSRTVALKKQLVDAKTKLAETNNELKNSGKSAEDAGKGWETLGKVAKGAMAALGAAAAAAGAAAVSLGKEIVSSYADFEQLSGGVETLFAEAEKKTRDLSGNLIKGGDDFGKAWVDDSEQAKSAIETVMSNANAAFRTAGLSANEYMETVTGFSASLIQSVGGDTQRAAALADQAIIDMADNANKMGSDISSIQTAYSGFSKGNFTMLDNLKLGYGGTKEEMQRLLDKANELQAAQGNYTDYSIDSYADIVEAIHVVQEEMGIAGATAREATTTISGSISAFSSAWQNLLTGLGSGKGDIGELVDYLIEAGMTVLDNVLPVIDRIVETVPEALTMISGAIVEKLPELLKTAVSLFRTILDALLNLLPELIPVAVQAVTLLADTIIDSLPMIIDGAVQLVLSLANGIGEALPELIPAAVDMILTIVEGLVENIGEIVEAGITLLMGLTNGLIAALPQLIEEAPVIIQSLVDALIENLPLLIDAAITLIVTLGAALVENLPKLLEAAAEIVFTIAEGIVDAFAILVEKGKEIVDKVKEGFKEKVDSAKDWGKDLISNFTDGITEKWNNLKKKVTDVASGIKNILGFSEPKEGPLSNFHTYAPDMMDLFAKGIQDKTPALKRQIAESFDFGDSIGSSLSIPQFGAAATMGGSTVSLDAGSLAALNAAAGQKQQNVVVQFKVSGSLQQLARVLLPELTTASRYAGVSLVEG